MNMLDHQSVKSLKNNLTFVFVLIQIYQIVNQFRRLA